MATSRVGEVKLRLRIAGELAGSAERIRTTVERELLVRILDELERLLHTRYGADAVIRIRRLAVSWRLDELELASIEVVARLAHDLADQLVAELEALAPVERLRPRGEALAMFRTVRHADAAYLADVADGTHATWIHTQHDAAEVWRATAVAGPGAIREVVTYLIEMERLVPALELATDAVLAVVEREAEAAAPAVALARARVLARRGDTSIASRAEDAGGVPRVPSAELPPPGDRAVSTDGAVSPAVTDAPQPRAAARTSTTHSPVAESAGPEPAAADSATPGVAALDELTRRGPSATTRYAGMFYLAGRVLEIELAERLWAAGLPEGDVLAHVVATLAGDADDPGWAWFGGAFERRPAAFDVPAWAAAEVSETVQHALGRRLVRFGVTSSPAVLADQLDRIARELVPPIVLSPSLHRVVTRGAAALCVIVAARLGRPPSVDDVRALCTRSGHLVLASDALHVVMPESAIDIDHRRAGLDQNPGNVPWLGRIVLIEFAGV